MSILEDQDVQTSARLGLHLLVFVEITESPPGLDGLRMGRLMLIGIGYKRVEWPRPFKLHPAPLS